MFSIACTNDAENEITINEAQVTVRFAYFSIAQEDCPVMRATTAVTDYSAEKALTLAFFRADGTLQYCATQLKDDAYTYTTFGQFSLTLPCATYTMVALGYNSTVPVVFNGMNDVMFGETKSRETFCCTQSITVSEAIPIDISATLSRISTRVIVQSTDNRPADVVYLRMIPSKGGKGFNPTTGFATTNTGFSNVIEISSAVGTTVRANTPFFLASDEETMDITIETLEAGENVFHSVTVSDVPMKRNRSTILTGSIFTPGVAAGSFLLGTDWEEDVKVDF